MAEYPTSLVRGVKVTEIPEGKFAGLYGPGFQIGVTKPGHCGHAYKIGECPLCWPQEPTVTKGPELGGERSTIETHPAYGQIRASRVSGSEGLYGSDFNHQHYMIIEIVHSELYRDSSHDRYVDRSEIVQVALSEAQWATFVSSTNAGSGVPCTVESIQGKRVPRIKRQVDRRTQFKGEAIDRLRHALDELAALRARIVAGKGGREALAMLDKAVQEIDSNLGFVADQFGEHMEQEVEKAKIEVVAYVQSAIMRAGLTSLQGGPPIVMLGAGDVVDAEIEGDQHGPKA